MKVIATFVALVVFVQAVSYKDVFEAEWDAFKVSYDKSYQDASEEQLRKQIFKDNKDIIDKHNKRYDAGEETFWMGVNQFTDLLPKEFAKLMLRSHNASKTESNVDLIYFPPANIEIPDSVDWRDKGAVTEVKNQGPCGSCWAFSTVATLEGHHFLKTKELVRLSEQNLVDCSHRNYGCDGGNEDIALEYIMNNHGIDTESSYPYRARQGHCRFNRNNVGATVSGIVRIKKGREDHLAIAVAEKGPISVAIDATNLQLYKGGVFRKPCRHGMNHAVTVVGYGHDSRDGDYWLVKNSWSTRFGEKGYVRMARNRRQNCYIADDAVYPVV